jgi:ABC-type phosphate transport system permease subunit
LVGGSRHLTRLITASEAGAFGSFCIIICHRTKAMSSKRAIVGVLTPGCMIASVMILPSVTSAQNAKVKATMEILRSKAEKLGPARTEGIDTVAGKNVPAIYFGTTKQSSTLRRRQNAPRYSLGYRR